ncbi:MAG: DUF423 domain-containing protein [Gammaproteobacteria bacterium]|nr:DUF423 domain-containing protein [Gammaproteobacteria bacterium]
MIGSVGGFLSVAFGAFGAHAIKQVLSADLMTIYQTAVSYQIYHSLALILIALIYQQHPHQLVKVAGWLMLCGTIIFSASLYTLALTDTRWLGAITPLGGSLLLLAWLLLALGTGKKSL